MINDDVLIKYAYKRGHAEDWPDFVMKMRERLGQVKLGFPGIGNDDLSLIEFKKIKPGDLFIYDTYIETPDMLCDDAPIMFKLEDDGRTAYIEGIGKGPDTRDPWRNKIRWRDTITLPPINPEFLVYRVNSRPTMNGGPAYYYFFKAYHDNRD